jgi:hypothetical protein
MIELLNADSFITNAPDLQNWIQTKDDIYYVYENDMVRALYEERFNLKPNTILSTYLINKNHYKDRMKDVVDHINYFLTFYDIEKELFVSTLSVKFMIDQNPNLKQSTFKDLVMSRIITDSLMGKIKLMAHNLYTININTDKEGKYKSTPKITNEQAKQLVAISFCTRLILPLCIHYSNTNSSFKEKRDYIYCFNKIYLEIIEKFEKDDIKVFNALCKFVKYRVDRSYTADLPIWRKKAQLYGITKNLYLEELIHEVIIVKSLYKLTYNRSVVSFIDGIIFSYHLNFKHENFKVKPVEIDSEESSSDSDDYLSHAEALEMSVYRIDESNAMINDVNVKKVISSIDERFNIEIHDDEFRFYFDNIKINPITQMFLHAFYSRYFKNSYAIYNLNKNETIKLLIYMKKYFQLRDMNIIAQIITSKIKGRFKDNSIKNSKFIEKLQTSSVYNNIIKSKFSYIHELNPKDDLIIKKLSTIINSTFEFIDYNEYINNMVYDDINVDLIIDEFLLFLSII